jgi:hypothetical protein
MAGVSCLAQHKVRRVRPADIHERSIGGAENHNEKYDQFEDHDSLFATHNP